MGTIWYAVIRRHAVPFATVSSIGFRRDIQGLRVVAVSLVILSHFEIPLLTDGGIQG